MLFIILCSYCKKRCATTIGAGTGACEQMKEIMQETEDNDIVLAVKSGDTQAFAVLVRKYHRHVLNFIFQIVHDENIVEDIGQEIFINIYRNISGFDERRGVPFSAWLFIVARNRCISELRKRKSSAFFPIIDELPASDNVSPEIAYQKKEQRLALRKALENLEEPFREVILQSLKGKSIKEISCACKVPNCTVKTRIFRAKEKLRLLLGGVHD